MTRIELAPEVLDDFDRCFDHMAPFEIADAAERSDEIIEAIHILARHPLIGRKAKRK